MGTGAPPILRIPLTLLAAADLTLLGMRLWPWQEVANLPGNGTTGLDPVLTLLAYIALLFWVGGNKNPEVRKALSAGTMIGLPAGILLVAQVLLAAQPVTQPIFLQIGLLGVAAILWGIAGMRGAQIAGNSGIGMLSGMWSAMVSCLMACAAVLEELSLAGPAPVTQDPWKQYEGLAIGNPAVQALVHSLNTATAFLLIGPLVGVVLGLLFALSAQGRKG